MLDSHTIYLVGFVSQVVFALTLALLAFTDRRTRGTAWFAAAAWLQLLMTSLRALLHLEGDTVLVSGGSCLLVLVFFFIYMGMRWFTVRRPLATRRGPIAVSAVMALILGLSALHLTAGMSTARIAAAVLLIMTVPMVWRTRIPAMQQTSRLAAFLVSGLALTLLGRIGADLMYATAYGHQIALIGRVATMFVATGLSFCFVGFFVAETQRRLHDETRVDMLTGLRNRRSMEEVAARAVRAAASNGTPLSLLVIDVDLFKNLNDTWGHAVGDRALEALGNALIHNMGEQVCTARLGGEEFAVLLPGMRMEDAAEVAEYLRQRIAELRIDEGTHKLNITVSIGIAALRAGERSWVDMLRRADKALYRAKNEGRNRVSMWCERDGTRGSRSDSKLRHWRRPWSPIPPGADKVEIRSKTTPARVLN